MQHDTNLLTFASLAIGDIFFIGRELQSSGYWVKLNNNKIKSVSRKNALPITPDTIGVEASTGVTLAWID